MPKRRAASRWLSPSTWQAWRPRAYSSTAFILTLPAVRTGRKIRRRLFTPPPRPDTPAASVMDFLSAAHSWCVSRGFGEFDSYRYYDRPVTIEDRANIWLGWLGFVPAVHLY